jgi:NAD(P)H dehydrogenase (quinone)
MGRAPIAMVDVRDVAACAVVALTAEEPTVQAWSLTGPRGVTYAQLGRLLGVPYLNVPPKLAAHSLRRQGADAWEVEHALRMATALAAGSAAATTSTVRHITGRPPRTVEAFLDEHRAAFTR